MQATPPATADPQLGAAAAALAILLVLFGAYAVVRRRGGVTPFPHLRQTYISIDADKDAPSADEVFLQTSRRLIDSQISSSDILDGRIATTFGVGSTVLPITIGLLDVANRDGAAVAGATSGWLIAAIVAFSVVIAAALASYVRREWAVGAAIEDIRLLSETFDGAQLRRRIAEDDVRSARRNRAVLQWKGRCALVAALALYVEAGCLSIAAFLTVT